MSWWVLKRKIHTSWLIAFLCGAIFIGIFVAQYIRFQFFSTIFCLIIATIFIVIALWRKYIYLIPFLILGGLFIGLWRGSILQNDLSQYKSLYGLIISIEGTVKDDADTGTADQIVIRLDKIVIKNR